LTEVQSSKALTAQNYLITSGFEVGRCKVLFSYWLAEIKVMKKSSEMLRCLQSQSLKEPPADL
jgi:hypothetical protein